MTTESMFTVDELSDLRAGLGLLYGKEKSVVGARRIHELIEKVEKAKHEMRVARGDYEPKYENISVEGL